MRISIDILRGKRLRRNIKKLNLCVVSTLTNLTPLVKAVDDIEKGFDVKFDVNLFYTHILDEMDVESFQETRDTIINSDIILLDIRTPGSWFVDKLGDAINVSRAKICFPVVGGSPKILSLLKVGRHRLSIPSKEESFDTEYLNMNKVWRILDIIEKGGRFIPVGSLKNFRNWILATRYWEYSGYKNMKNMLLMILKEYYGFKIKYEQPKEYAPDGFLYHPDLGFLNNFKRFRIEKSMKNNPYVVILAYAGMHFDQCKPIADILTRYLENKGINVITQLGGASRNLDRQPEYLENLLRESRISFDAIINLQWFRLRGGPYGGDPKPTLEVLRSFDCPLFNGLMMYMREIDKWKTDPHGISPIEVVTGVALPEADGAIEPIPLAALQGDTVKNITPIKDRMERRIGRLVNWIKLRKKDNRDKKIALIIYNYPPGEYNIGSAAYLDVFSSLESLLKSFKEAGYTTEIVDKKTLKELFTEHLVNSPEWTILDNSKAIKISLEEYLKYFNDLPESMREKVVKTWGKPPGNIMTDNDLIIIPGNIFGNIFIGLQPTRGVHEDQSKLYHNKDLPSHHQYLAFYWWLNNKFNVDAIIHIGTHGTLEFMPGKEVGLSTECFPDQLIGNAPHIYIYHVTNPSEMTIAKRRGYAYVITHSTPPFTVSGLYEEYTELEDLLHEYEEAKIQDPERISVIKKMIDEKARNLNISYKDIDDIHDKIYSIKRSLIPKGLHILGEVWSDEDTINYITYLLRYDREIKSLHRLIAETEHLDYDELLEDYSRSKILEGIEREVRSIVNKVIKEDDYRELLRVFPSSHHEELEKIIGFIRGIASNIKASEELNSILKVLNGKYIKPRVAGDPIRSPEIWPIGSHGYAFDPRLIPSQAAYKRGVKVSEGSLKKYYERHGHYPETIAVVLWGFETIGTRGETIGQILNYLGVKLVRKHGPWSTELELIPISELKRPRIDVVITICGIFRDTFPHLITLLDRAVRMVADADESEDLNFIKKHVTSVKSEIGEGNAMIRIFGPKNGAYNTRLTDMIETSAWEDEDELVSTYVEDMSYGYSEYLHGALSKDLFKYLLQKIDLVTQVRYANEYEITDLDHYYEFFGGLSKSVESLKGEMVDSIWIDTTLEKIRLKETKDAIDHATRSRLLNPKWIDGMIKHGYDGIREIANRVEYMLGLAATTGAVKNWMWNMITDRYIFDEEIRNKMLELNKWAVYVIAKRLYEAYKRGYWKPNEETLRKFEETSSLIEGWLEE